MAEDGDSVSNSDATGQTSIDAKPYDDLTIADAVAFFISRNARANCEICEANSWAFTIDAKGRSPMIIAREDYGAYEDELILPTFITTCSNCGNIRTFARHIIQKWKAEMPTTDAEE